MDGIRDLLHNRGVFIDEICSEGKTKPELVEATGKSRSTVDRSIRELQAQGLVEADASSYVTTVTAEHLGRIREQYLSDIELTYEHREFLNALEPGEEIPTSVLEGATKLEIPAGMPGKVLAPVDEALDNAVLVRGITPLYLGAYDRIYYERIVEGDLRLDTINNEEVFKHVRDQFRDRWQTMLETGRVTARVHDSMPSYALGVVKTPETTYTYIHAHGDKRIEAAIANDTDEAARWAEAKLDRYREEATHVGGPEEVWPE